MCGASEQAKPRSGLLNLAISFFKKEGFEDPFLSFVVDVVDVVNVVSTTGKPIQNTGNDNYRAAKYIVLLKQLKRQRLVEREGVHEADEGDDDLRHHDEVAGRVIEHDVDEEVHEPQRQQVLGEGDDREGGELVVHLAGVHPEREGLVEIEAHAHADQVAHRLPDQVKDAEKVDERVEEGHVDQRG